MATSSIRGLGRVLGGRGVPAVELLGRCAWARTGCRVAGSPVEPSHGSGGGGIRRHGLGLEGSCGGRHQVDRTWVPSARWTHGEGPAASALVSAAFRSRYNPPVQVQCERGRCLWCVRCEVSEVVNPRPGQDPRFAGGDREEMPHPSAALLWRLCAASLSVYTRLCEWRLHTSVRLESPLISMRRRKDRSLGPIAHPPTVSLVTRLTHCTAGRAGWHHRHHRSFDKSSATEESLGESSPTLRDLDEFPSTLRTHPPS
jgi:hypothetical protein